jgi:hypothetical protein
VATFIPVEWQTLQVRKAPVDAPEIWRFGGYTNFIMEDSSEMLIGRLAIFTISLGLFCLFMIQYLHANDFTLDALQFNHN